MKLLQQNKILGANKTETIVSDYCNVTLLSEEHFHTKLGHVLLKIKKN